MAYTNMHYHKLFIFYGHTNINNTIIIMPNVYYRYSMVLYIEHVCVHVIQEVGTKYIDVAKNS